MFLFWINSLFKLTIDELDGNLNRLNTETIRLQYYLAKRRKVWNFS